MRHVTSTSAAVVQHCRRLGRDAAYRREHKQVLLHGVTALTELLGVEGHCHTQWQSSSVSSPRESPAAWPPTRGLPLTDVHSVLVGREFEAAHPRLFDRLTASGTAVVSVSDRAHRAAAGVHTVAPAAVTAVVRYPQPVPPHDLWHAACRGIVAAHAMGDPGNVGALFRTAHALGWRVALCPVGCDVGNPKVVRASRGGVFRVPYSSCSWEELMAQCKHGWGDRADVMFAVAAGGADTQQMERKDAVPVLCLGNEVRGLQDVELPRTGRAVSVDTAPDAESLNVAAAAAILMHSVGRQP